MNSSACRRSSSATIGGWVEIVDTTEHAHAAALHRLDERAEVAVAREQHHVVDEGRELERVDRELDVHVALDLAPAGRVDELLGRLRHHPVAVVVEPVDQRPDRGVFLVLDSAV